MLPSLKDSRFFGANFREVDYVASYVHVVMVNFETNVWCDKKLMCNAYAARVINNSRGPYAATHHTSRETAHTSYDSIFTMISNCKEL